MISTILLCAAILGAWMAAWGPDHWLWRSKRNKNRPQPGTLEHPALEFWRDETAPETTGEP